MQVDLSTRDPDIAGMTANSQAVEPGFLFAALPGTRVDGRDFIADALARGAVAVLAPPGTMVFTTGPVWTAGTCTTVSCVRCRIT